MHVIKGSRILVVQNCTGSTTGLCDVLARNGHACTHASTGIKALELLGSMRPDAVIIDSALPDMAGVDLCAKMRARGEFADTPIIMISERNDLSLRLKGFMAGAQKFLIEPVAEKDILEQVQTLTARARPGASKSRSIAKLIERELKAGLVL